MADFDVVTVGVDTYESKLTNFTRTRSIWPRSCSARYLQAHPSCNLTLVERKFCLGGVCEASNGSTPKLLDTNGLGEGVAIPPISTCSLTGRQSPPVVT